MNLPIQPPTACATRCSVPAAANEQGAPNRRTRVVEINTRPRDHSVCDRSADCAAPSDAGTGSFLQRLADMLFTWMQRHRQRRALQKLSDAMLKDIGISRADVDAEISRHFWQE